MSEQLDEMYRDIILDHYRSPRGAKPLPRADITSAGHNPSCGDELTLQVEMADGTIKDVHVDCKGCAISVASGSMLADIGQQARTAESGRSMQASLLKEIENRRDEVSGVSIDEEVTNLIRLQASFQANARVVQTIGRLLDDVLSIL